MTKHTPLTIVLAATVGLSAAPVLARNLPEGTVAIARMDARFCNRQHTPGSADEMGFAAVLAATVVPLLVKTGVSALGASIQSAASDTASTPVVVAHSNNFYLTPFHDRASRNFDVKPQHRCLAILVTSPEAANARSDQTRPTGAGVPANRLFSELPDTLPKEVHLPHLLATWRIEYSADKTAFRLVPERVVVGSALTARQARSRRRDLAISVTMHLPAVKETDGAIGSALMLIPAIAGPITWEGEEAASLATRWWPTPALPQGSADQLKSILQREADILALADDIEDTSDAKKRAALVIRKRRLEDRNLKAIAAFTKPGGIAPFTVQFTVTETRQGSKLVAAMGKALSDQAETIASAVGDRLDPDKRLAAELSAFDKETEARLAAVADVEAWQGLVAENKPASTALQKARRSCERLQMLEFYVSECNSLPGGS